MQKYPHIDKKPNTEIDWFDALWRLARYLRTEDGCPWDRGKTAQDFAGFAVEEAEELVEACAENDNPHMEEEFGDSLFTLLASAAAAEEEGRFTLHDALQRAHAKMIRRHDHVFGEEKADTSEEAMKAWMRVKAEEQRAKDEA